MTSKLTLGAVVVAFAAGWVTQGWRLDGIAERARAERAEQTLKQIEQLELEVTNAGKKLKEAEIRIASATGVVTERVRWRVAACRADTNTGSTDETSPSGWADEGGSDFGAVKSGVIALGADLNRCAAQLEALQKVVENAKVCY